VINAEDVVKGIFFADVGFVKKQEPDAEALIMSEIDFQY
jgi:hypothetical protein